MEEKVRLYVNKKEMHEYIVAAVFNCIVAIIIAGLVFIRFDSLVDFISYVPVLAEAKRSRVGKAYNINGLSRLLGTLIISIATWTFFSCKINNLSMDALVLADVAIILGFDIYFNDATFFQKKI